MRSTLILIMLLFPALEVLLMLVLNARLRQFRRAVPELRTREDVVRLRRLVSGQMYASLLVPPLTFGPFLAWVYGMFAAKIFAWPDLLLYGVLPYFVALALIKILERPAKAIRETPTTDPEHHAERNRIVEVWRKRLLPDW